MAFVARTEATEAGTTNKSLLPPLLLLLLLLLVVNILLDNIEFAVRLVFRYIYLVLFESVAILKLRLYIAFPVLLFEEQMQLSKVFRFTIESSTRILITRGVTTLHSGDHQNQ